METETKNWLNACIDLMEKAQKEGHKSPHITLVRSKKTLEMFIFLREALNGNSKKT